MTLFQLNVTSLVQKQAFSKYKIKFFCASKNVLEYVYGTMVPDSYKKVHGGPIFGPPGAQGGPLALRLVKQKVIYFYIFMEFNTTIHFFTFYNVFPSVGALKWPLSSPKCFWGPLAPQALTYSFLTFSNFFMISTRKNQKIDLLQILKTLLLM